MGFLGRAKLCRKGTHGNRDYFLGACPSEASVLIVTGSLVEFGDISDWKLN